jgi:hypothetical protein
MQSTDHEARRVSRFNTNWVRRRLWKLVPALLCAITLAAGALIDGSSGSANAALPSAVVVAPSTNAPIQLRIRAYIDGQSQLILQGSSAQWYNEDWAAPGRWGGKNLPTYLNGHPWTPQWSTSPPDQLLFCHCYSTAANVVDPPIPATSPVNLTPVVARYAVSIAQQPSAANGFTTIIDFNDDPPPFPAWYDVVLTFGGTGLGGQYEVSLGNNALYCMALDGYGHWSIRGGTADAAIVGSGSVSWQPSDSDYVFTQSSPANNSQIVATYDPIAQTFTGTWSPTGTPPQSFDAQLASYCTPD